MSSTRTIIWCTGLTVLIGYGVRARLQDTSLTIDDQHELVVNTLFMILMLWWLLPFGLNIVAPPRAPKPARPQPKGGFGYSFNLDEDEDEGGDFMKLLLFVGVVALGAYVFVKVANPSTTTNINTPQATDFTGYVLEAYFSPPVTQNAIQIPNLDVELALVKEDKTDTRFGAYLKTVTITNEVRKRMDDDAAKRTGVDRLMMYVYYLNLDAANPTDRDRELVPLYLLLLAYRYWDMQGFTATGKYIEADGKYFAVAPPGPQQAAPYQVYTHDGSKKLMFRPDNKVYRDAFRMDSYAVIVGPPTEEKTYTLDEIGTSMGLVFPVVIQKTFPKKNCGWLWCDSFPSRNKTYIDGDLAPQLFPKNIYTGKIDSFYTKVKEPFGQWMLPLRKEE